MTKKAGLIAEKIHLLRVDILHAAIDNPLELIEEKVSEFKFGLDYEAGFSPEAQLVKTELSVSLHTELEDREAQAGGRFKLAFLYQIDNFDELVQKQGDDQLEVNPDLNITLASISYSTARGILLTRFQGTIFRDFILPVISPGSLLEQRQPEI